MEHLGLNFSRINFLTYSISSIVVGSSQYFPQPSSAFPFLRIFFSFSITLLYKVQCLSIYLQRLFRLFSLNFSTLLAYQPLLFLFTLIALQKRYNSILFISNLKTHIT